MDERWRIWRACSWIWSNRFNEEDWEKGIKCEKNIRTQKKKLRTKKKRNVKGKNRGQWFAHLLESWSKDYFKSCNSQKNIKIVFATASNIKAVIRILLPKLNLIQENETYFSLLNFMQQNHIRFRWTNHHSVELNLSFAKLI